jgi:hypothetical protein
MALTREERKLLHQKSKQPTFGTGKPESSEGNNGDLSFRQVEGSGTVQYVKAQGNWVAVASSGEMPAIRTTGSSSMGTSGGVTTHSSLNGLLSDDHTQYLLIDGSRAMTGDLSIGGGDGALTFTNAGENSIKIPDNQASALIIEEADTAYLTFVTTDSGEKITLGKKLEAGSVEIEGSAFDIDGGDVSAITISGDLTWSSDQSGVSSLSLADAKNINLTTGNIILTPSADDTITIDGATHGVLNITTVDDAGADANINITADGVITIDSANNIILDTAGANNDVIFKNGGTERFAFKNDSTPELDVTGEFILDGSAGITIDSVGETSIKTNGSTVVRASTAGNVFLHAAANAPTGYFASGIQMKKDIYHFSTGFEDFKQNFTMLNIYKEPDTFEAYPS